MKRLFKHFVIARSGVYEYHAKELRQLDLDINDAPEKKELYTVFRPATVLVRDKAMFLNMPVTFRHPDEFLENDTYRQYIVGYTSNDIEVECLDDIDEISLNSSLSLIDDDAINAYESGIDNVSPGYYAEFVWKNGVTEKGEPYDIIMIKIKEEANHLALCENARGGSEVKITDSKEGGKTMPKLFSGIWRSFNKKKSGVKDADEGAFKTAIEGIVKDRGSISDEDLTKKIGDLNSFLGDLPESEGKVQLENIITDMPTQIKGLDDPSVAELTNGMVDLYQKLDTKAEDDADILPSEETSDEEEKEETTTPADVEPEEPAATPEEQTNDSEMTPEKALQIVQDIAKLLQGATDEEEKPKEEEKPTDEEKEKEETSDEEEEEKGAKDSMYNTTIGKTTGGIDPVSEWMKKKKKRSK